MAAMCLDTWMGGGDGGKTSLSLASVLTSFLLVMSSSFVLERFPRTEPEAGMGGNVIYQEGTLKERASKR